MHTDLSAVQPLDSTPSVSGDEKALALAAHLSTLVAPVLGPLIAYVVALGMRASGHARQHAAAALNFHLTMGLVIGALFAAQFGLAFGGLVLTASSESLWGMLMGFGVTLLLFGFIFSGVVVSLVFTVLACVAAARGQPYRYPLSFKIVR